MGSLTRSPALSAAALAALLASGQPSGAQSAASVAERYGNWSLTCETGLCQAFFGLRHPTEDWELFRWSIFHDPGSATFSTVIRTPTGIALPPGLRVWTGAQEWTEMAYQVCDPTGCEAGAVLDETFRHKLLEAGDEVTVSFIPYGETKPTGIKVNIAGLDSVLKRLPGLR